jgi:hypothetical protein
MTAGRPLVVQQVWCHPALTGAADAFLAQFTGLPAMRVRRDTGIMHFGEVPVTLVEARRLRRQGLRATPA